MKPILMLAALSTLLAQTGSYSQAGLNTGSLGFRANHTGGYYVLLRAGNPIRTGRITFEEFDEHHVTIDRTDLNAGTQPPPGSNPNDSFKLAFGPGATALFSGPGLCGSRQASAPAHVDVTVTPNSLAVKCSTGYNGTGTPMPLITFR